MISIVMLVVALIAGAIVARLSRKKTGGALEPFYATVVFVSIGLGCILFGFIPHVFFPDYIAKNIGWPTGSPFQFEVGIHNACWGILGLLALRYRGGFIQATVLGFSIFLIVAGANHLKGMIAQSNYAAYNVQFILGDWLPAFVLLFLAVKYRKHQAIARATRTEQG